MINGSGARALELSLSAVLSAGLDEHGLLYIAIGYVWGDGKM